MSGAVSIADQAPWLSDAGLQKLIAALSNDGEAARIAGGAVRNALLGQPVADIDIATTTPPQETTRRALEAGFRVVPTGIEHGTVTVLVEGRPVEVTTLRADVATDGRHATVRFGRDWQADAGRRDFTINALYAEADGTVVDLVGGLRDIEERRLRFIGDAEARIREDFLRILRFFRFFAWYGQGRPDAEGVKACARLKDGLSRLSAERVWSELRKLLSAPDPSRALLWMRQAGVLSAVLPESANWGIDAIHGLVAAERDLEWSADPLLRLEAIVPPDPSRMEGLADRLKLSNAERLRLRYWASGLAIDSGVTETAMASMLYRGDPQGIADQLKLRLASARAKALTDDGALVQAGGFYKLLRFAEGWDKPQFPLKGADLLGAGLEAGPKMGEVLARLENEWVESGFRLDRDALLRRVTESS